MKQVLDASSLLPSENLVPTGFRLITMSSRNSSRREIIIPKLNTDNVLRRRLVNTSNAARLFRSLWGQHCGHPRLLNKGPKSMFNLQGQAL